MAEPGPDCSSLLDEDLSSFVFSYLADSQVGQAVQGLCCPAPQRGATCRGEGGRLPASRAHGGEKPVPASPRWGKCGGRLLPQVPGGSAGVPFAPRMRRGGYKGRGEAQDAAAPAALSVPVARGGPGAAAAPQPRRRFQHHSHVDSRVPPRAGNLGRRGTS